jgi:hypothetical protein
MAGDDPENWSLATVRPNERHIGAIALRQPALEIRAFALDAPNR